MTLHNEHITVPDLITMKIDDVEKKLSSESLKYEIIDSIHYNDKLEKNSVVDQLPLAGELVKVNRVIYLTINSSSYYKDTIPDVFQKSKRQVIPLLESKGFKIRNLKYVPDLGKDILLEIRHENKIVEKHELLRVGAELDLVFGSGLSNKKVSLPNVMGLTLNKAKKVLKRKSLTLGSVVYDGEIVDTLNAIIYNQFPKFKENTSMYIGESLDVWLLEVGMEE
ncbi:PASTA domain-containing protein [Ichthyobacterium seriolicida]|nr:PASTA domain-containing protein [Ichthyobacterium seriolicida]